MIQRELLDPQRRQCGVAKHLEAPLIRIRDERDLLGPQHAVRARRHGDRRLNLFVRDQQSVEDEPLVQARPEEAIEVFAMDPIDLTVENVSAPEDEAVRIAEGTRLELRSGTHLRGRG
jgi:hypothetical protein